MQRSEELKLTFIKRYAIAISLIIILFTAVFYILDFAFDASSSTALQVNISEKQEMLSQKITSSSQQYYYNMDTDSDRHRLISIASTLQDAIGEMRSANEALSSGRLKDTLHVELSPAVHELYFGNTALKKQVDTYVQSVETLLQAKNSKEAGTILVQIVKQSNRLSPDLHTAVLQYQKEYEENIIKIHALGTAAWILMLITLLLEIIFIFQPMATKIRILFSEVIWNRHNLAQEIKIRTLSLEQANMQLEHLASHDPLTGLKNRLNMENELETLVIHYHQNHAPYAILMLDIDWFKKINDNYGHDVGDFVLQDLASLLLRSVREQDSVYRAGGEEFIVLFNRITGEEALDKANKLRLAVQEHLFAFNDHQIRLTISGGIYHPEFVGASNYQGVLKLADNALYEAKRAGRNTIVKASDGQIDFAAPLYPSQTLIRVDGNDLKKISFADAEVVEILGYSREMLTEGDISLLSIVHPDDLDIMDSLVMYEPFVTMLRVILPSGNIKIIRAEFSPIQEKGWEIRIQDPLMLAQAVEDKMTVENFEAMMTDTDDYIYFKDTHHVFTAASRTLVPLANVERKEDLIGKTDFEVFPKEYADKYFKLEKEVLTGKIEVAREIQQTFDQDEKTQWVDHRKYPIKNADGEIIGLFGIARILYDYPKNI